MGYDYEPHCPWCGAIIDDLWEVDFGPGLDGNTVIGCNYCDKWINIERVVDVAYRVTKHEEDTSNK